MPFSAKAENTPYLVIILFITAMDTTRENWLKKLVKPRGMNLAISGPRRGKLVLDSLTALILNRYTSEMTAVMTCPATVAMAAPVTPQSRRKMATGSRMMLAAAPARVAAMASLGLPSERMMGFMAWPNI